MNAMLFPDGINAQPAVLARSAAALTGPLDEVPGPKEDQVVALVGIGASEHAARGAAHAWRAAGLRAFALSAAEILANPDRTADLYLAISESGRSTETIRAVEAIGNRPTIVLTNDPGSPLAVAVDFVLPLTSGDDSPVYTTGYTATLQALGLIGEKWSGRQSDWSTLPGLAQQVLDSSAPVVEALADTFGKAQIVDVIASGTSGTTAGEGALMLRESARLHTASHETHNYLHGPMEPLDEHTACLVIGDDREPRLARDAAGFGAPTTLITTRADIEPVPGLTVLRLPDAGSPLAQAVLEILPIQRLAWSIATGRGLAVNGFRHQPDDTKVG
jgi:fructoselysine-6-P-deglycase FrlB-like protein